MTLCPKPTTAIWPVIVWGVLGVFHVDANEAVADDWMFRRSYYSHEIPEELRENYPPPPPRRTAYRRPMTGYGPGFAVRGGYRWNRVTLGRGRNTDTLMLRENFFEYRP
ncbi:hypothetical protein [Thalassoroseus pseudoceratinae]|uniref:hypothetical protein n=1 Tax=Thalassoroseus pseudoceratinae TaxID=2713176 RepID=UPI00141DCB8D|nr:hypothetical protein [Thalassoroseus pseudoceratinae]